MQNFIKIYKKIILASRFHFDNICDKIIMQTFKKINIYPRLSPCIKSTMAYKTHSFKS